MIVAASLAASLTATETLTLGTTSQTFPELTAAALSWTNGTGAGAVDLHYESAAITLAASASTTFALSALTDLLGRAVSFAKVRALVLSVTSRTAGDFLTVGDPTASLSRPWAAPFGGATQSAKVYDLEIKAATADGFAVVSGSSDQLLVKNSGSNPVTFVLSLAGTSV